MLLYLRQADEYRRKHGEHIGLDEGYQHFDGVHEDTEEYRYHTHRCMDEQAHASGDEDDARHSQDDGVPGHDVGKQTYHQGKGFGKETEDLDDGYQR